MNLIDRIRDYLRGGPPGGLRNKRGGMAWINAGIDNGAGLGVLVNRVVRTVHLHEADRWKIDPPQSFHATAAFLDARGVLVTPGKTESVIAISDACLTPIPGDLVDGEEIPREFFVAPKLPQEV